MERGGLKGTNVGGTSAFQLVQFCQSLAIIISENATSEDHFSNAGFEGQIPIEISRLTIYFI